MGAGAILAATIVSAAASAYGAYQSVQTAKFNEKVGQANAQAAKNKAAYDEDLHRERVRRLMSKQKALFGASGVESSTGSPLDVLEETAAQGEMDALAIRAGGDVAAAQARTEGTLRSRRARAQAVGQAGRAGSTLLGGIGRYNP